MIPNSKTFVLTIKRNAERFNATMAHLKEQGVEPTVFTGMDGEVSGLETTWNSEHNVGHRGASRSMFEVTGMSNDIINAEAFIAQLKLRANGITDYVFRKMRDNASEALFAKQTLLHLIIFGLNKILEGPSIYEDSKINGLSPFESSMSDETKLLLLTNPSGWELIRLNRKLLEDAFPGEIAKDKRIGWRMGSAEVNIYFSHYALWKVCSYQPHDAFVILEDDVRLYSDWMHHLTEAMAAIPSDWDLLYVGSCCTEDKLDRKQISGRLWRINYANCTHAYVVRKKALPFLLEKLQKMEVAVDIAMALEAIPHLQTYAILPSIASQEGTPLHP